MFKNMMALSVILSLISSSALADTRVRVILSGYEASDIESSGFNYDQVYFASNIGITGQPTRFTLTETRNAYVRQPIWFETVLFEEVLKNNQTVSGGIIGYEADCGRKWQKFSDLADEAIVAAFATGAIGAVTALSAKAASLVCSMDDDDFLGQYKFDKISAQGPAAEELPIPPKAFYDKGPWPVRDYSNWNYKVVLKVTREQI